VLTKPIGTGIIATAIKNGACEPAVRDAAVASMVELNADAADAARGAGIVAGTDVTGFGLLGHLSEITSASGLSAEVEADEVPLLPGAAHLAAEGHIPGGTRRNLTAVERSVDFGTLGDHRLLLADAQTSGGLLLCAPPDRLDPLLSGLRERDVAAWVIGELLPADEGPTLRVR
jgi:selenide,water dikinase